MPIVTHCTVPGCETLTLGPFCLAHDEPTTRIFVRGRPARAVAKTPARFATTSLAQLLVGDLRTASEREPAALARR
jgi:hypothetical protein